MFSGLLHVVVSTKASKRPGSTWEYPLSGKRRDVSGRRCKRKPPLWDMQQPRATLKWPAMTSHIRRLFTVWDFTLWYDWHQKRETRKSQQYLVPMSQTKDRKPRADPVTMQPITNPVTFLMYKFLKSRAWNGPFVQNKVLQRIVV